MRLAVIQHLLRKMPAEDREALVASVLRVARAGAHVVLIPDAGAFLDDTCMQELQRQVAADAPDTALFLASEAACASGAVMQNNGPLGRTALLCGDACMDPAEHTKLWPCELDTLVLAPESESELQAEAMLELAVGLSTSLAPLVAIVEPIGALLGEAGHGGSAIVQLGEVHAEAVLEEEFVLADVELVCGPPSPRDPLPEIPFVLEQRLRAHLTSSVPGVQLQAREATSSLP